MRLSILVLAAALVVAGVASAGPYRPPRTPWGAPNLQGVWTNTALTMLERPPIFKALVATDAEAKMMEAGFGKLISENTGAEHVDPNAPAPPRVKTVQNSEWIEMSLHLARIDGQMRSSWIVEPADGKLPFTDAGKAARKAANKDDFDGPEGRPLTERCLTALGSAEGPPMLNTGYNGNYQIVQTPDHVAILVEMIHEVRIVRLVDRKHLPDAIHPWTGDSVGWYEGDTLVVETTNLNPRVLVASLSGSFTYSPQARLIERFTRTADDAILYQFQVDDPVNFKSVWKAEMPWRTAKGPIYEYACHEGNYSLPLALSGARVQERAAAAAPAATVPAQ
jgi:hypothetical protein